MSEVIYRKLSKIILQLKDKNIPKVEISFDGSGDSGVIQDIIAYTDLTSENVAGSIANKVGKIDQDLHTLIEDYAYDKICEKVNTVGDWVNGDGGYGYMYIHADTKKVNIQYYQRTTEDHDWSDLDIFK